MSESRRAFDFVGNCFSVSRLLLTRLFCIDHILLNMASNTDFDLVLNKIDTAQCEFHAELNALENNKNRRFAALRVRVNRFRTNQVVECTENNV